MRRIHVVWPLIALAALLVSCQGSPPEPKATPADPLAQAREAQDRGDYARAAALLRQFLVSHPNSLEAHYRLGVSASYLNLRDETIREFQWVVAQGSPGSPEVRTARNWLIQAGVLAERPPAQAATSPPPESTPAQSLTLASVSGKVLGEEGGLVKPLVRFRLFLSGVPNSPVKDKFYVLRTDQDGAYRFTNVTPGVYMLRGLNSGRPVWRLKVTLESGQNLLLDLTPGNSVKVRDDFPEGH